MLASAFAVLFCALLFGGVAYRSALVARRESIRAEQQDVVTLFRRVLLVLSCIGGSCVLGLISWVKGNWVPFVGVLGIGASLLTVYFVTALCPTFAIIALRDLKNRRRIVSKGVGGLLIVNVALILLFVLAFDNPVLSLYVVVGYISTAALAVVLSGIVSKGADRYADAAHKLRGLSRPQVAGFVDDAGDYFADLSNHVLLWSSMVLMIVVFGQFFALANGLRVLSDLSVFTIALSLAGVGAILLFRPIIGVRQVVDVTILVGGGLLGALYLVQVALDGAVLFNANVYVAIILGAVVVSLFVVLGYYSTSGRGRAGREVADRAVNHYARDHVVLSFASILMLLFAMVVFGVYMQWLYARLGIAGFWLLAPLVVGCGIPLMVASGATHVLDSAGAIARGASSKVRSLLSADDQVGNSLAGASKALLSVVLVIVSVSIIVSSGRVEFNVLRMFVASLCLLLLSWLLVEAVLVYERRFSRAVVGPRLFFVPSVFSVVVLGFCVAAVLVGRSAGGEVIFAICVLASVVSAFCAITGALYDNVKKVSPRKEVGTELYRRVVKLDLIGDVLKDVVSPGLLATSFLSLIAYVALLL